MAQRIHTGALALIQAQSELEVVAECPVCRGTERTQLFRAEDWRHDSPGAFPISQCHNCGLAYLTQRPTQRSIHEYYPTASYYSYQPRPGYRLFARTTKLAGAWYALKRAALATAHNYHHLHPNKQLARALSLPGFAELSSRITFKQWVLFHPYVRNGTLLDVGCGSGDYLDLMRALGWKNTVGVDFSEDAVAAARNALKLDVHCGQLQELRFAEDSFDAVTLSHTLEHIYDPIELLREVHRVMKPGGRLAIVVPNFESLGLKVFRERWMGLEPPRHPIHFTKKSLRLALQAAGFTVQRLTTTARHAYHFNLESCHRRLATSRQDWAGPQTGIQLSKRSVAALLAAAERIMCACGVPYGEELGVVATKPLPQRHA